MACIIALSSRPCAAIPKVKWLQPGKARRCVAQPAARHTAAYSSVWLIQPGDSPPPANSSTGTGRLGGLNIGLLTRTRSGVSLTAALTPIFVTGVRS